VSPTAASETTRGEPAHLAASESSDGAPLSLQLKATVVCADDDLGSLERLRLLLSREGFDVLASSDPSAALECIWKRLPDLMIIDPMMASGSGFGLCRRMRTHPETERIPIVLHTAAPAPTETRLFDCICVKPAERSVLLLAIRTLLMSRP
jgi:PleD family two-component response regulator